MKGCLQLSESWEDVASRLNLEVGLKRHQSHVIQEIGSLQAMGELASAMGEPFTSMRHQQKPG